MEQGELESNPWSSWLFAVITGAYAVATVAVANVILWIVSFSLSAGYEWIGGSGWFILFALGILVLLASLGAPVLIILGIIGAVVGGIAGGLAGAAVGLVCLFCYFIFSFYKPLRPIFMYPISLGLGVFFYSRFEFYRGYLHELSFLTWIDYLNFLLAGVAGLVIAWGFLTRPVATTPEEDEEAAEATKQVLGAPWRLYRRLGNWANTAHEKEQADYTFHSALGFNKSRSDLEAEFVKANREGDFKKAQAILKRLEKDSTSKTY
jgi:hypothetical protein